MLFSSSALLACFWNENSKKSIEFLEINNTANVTEQVKERQLHQQQLQGKKHPKWGSMIDWKSPAETQRARERSWNEEKRLSEEKEGKSHESCWRSWTGGSLPRQRLTSLMAVQNSLWRTFFRDWSLCPGTSPDSCSFSSSSMALATSGRYRVREEGEAVECTCVGTHAKGMEGEGGEKKCPPFNYINSTAMRKAPERINGWDNGNRLSEGQLGQERSLALARLYAFRSRTEE